MDAEHPTLSDDKAQWERTFADARARKVQQTRLNMDRREAKRKTPYKYVATVSQDKHEKAEKACAKLHNMSVLAWFHAGITAFADSPAGHISAKERERPGYRFRSERDKERQEIIEYELKSTQSHFPDGITMAEIIELCESTMTNDRSDLILIGRIMKNLGYRKYRTYIPKTDDAPAKLGWVYRKEINQ